MPRRTESGFTILELMIVVTIIGILAALAIPLFQVIVKKSKLTMLANDLRIHSGAIHQHAMQQGDYPSTFNSAGVIIPGMEGLLATSWKEPSPVGGVYTWVYTRTGNPANRGAYIQIVQTGNAPFTVGLAEIVSLDEQIDDGNLASGYMQVAGSRIRYFVKLPSKKIK